MSGSQDAASPERTKGDSPADHAAAPMLFFAPFVSSVKTIDPAWIDYNGHLNMAYYNVLFDEAVDEAFALCGLGPNYIATRGGSFFLVESRIRYRRELKATDKVRVTLRLMAVDDKRMHYAMEMREASEGWLAAACENISIHVDMGTRKATSFPDDIKAALSEMRNTHAALPALDWSGAGVTMPAKATRH